MNRASVIAWSLLAGSVFAAEPAFDTLIAHRGESVDAPENTLPAYRMAVERGFGFECDVYLSSDGRVFTFHDSTLTRTTGGANTNACGDVSWDVISQLDVGSWGKWAGSQYAGTRPALLEEVRGKIDAIDLGSVAMSQESIAEAMMARQWWNPFPKVRYTERPDAATACIMEGNIVLMVDNSPAAMLLPTNFFDFVQEANDFYFPPLVGSYLRILRYVVFLLTLFITPVWYLLVKTASTEGALHFLAIAEEYEVPLLAQLLFAEFIVDLLKLTSLNTPAVFSNSFSMIGALVLGDFAVQAHWMVPEVLAYMAFVAIANFAQPSYELGYAFKLLRLMLLLLIGLMDFPGLVLGCAVILVLLLTTKPIAGKGYLYPLVPFNPNALRQLLIRHPVSRGNT